MRGTCTIAFAPGAELRSRLPFCHIGVGVGWDTRC